MRRALIVSAVLVVVGIWWLRSTPEHVEERSEPLVSSPGSASSRPKTASVQTAPPPMQGADPFVSWRKIADRHGAHDDADPKWREASVARIDADLKAINDALRKANQGTFAPSVEAIDCRAKSCIVELRFASFPVAYRYVDLFEDSRFRFDYELPFSFECPLVRHAMPRVPGTTQEDFPVLMHFECK